MKPRLRLVMGSKKPKIKFASFGRERDLNMIEQYIQDPDLKARRLKQMIAVHDLNDGCGSVEVFIKATREAVFDSTESYRDEPLMLLARVANYYPECLKIWGELAESTLSKNRFSVACRLYWYVPEAASDRLFHVLRHDKSKRVRDIAISRYENRSGDDGYIVFGKFDANRFDERIRRGEVEV